MNPKKGVFLRLDQGISILLLLLQGKLRVQQNNPLGSKKECKEKYFPCFYICVTDFDFVNK
jgi:hypothetical protein